MLERFKQRSRFSCVIFSSCNLPNNESHGKSLCGRRIRFLQHIMVIKLGLSHTNLQNRKFKLFLIFSTLGAKKNRPQGPIPHRDNCRIESGLHPVYAFFLERTTQRRCIETLLLLLLYASTLVPIFVVTYLS